MNPKDPGYLVIELNTDQYKGRFEIRDEGIATAYRADPKRAELYLKRHILDGFSDICSGRSLDTVLQEMNREASLKKVEFLKSVKRAQDKLED